MKTIIRNFLHKTKLQYYLADYMEKLLLLLFGIGLGVKVIVINHRIDPSTLILQLMPADYVLVIFVPIAIVGLNLLINKWLPDNEADDDQSELNEILDIVDQARGVS